MPMLDVSELNFVVAVLGAFIILYGLGAVQLKNAWYLGEALPAVLIGILLGPKAAGVLNAERWGSSTPGQQDAITLGVMKVVIGIQLVIAGYQLPSHYLRTRYKEVFICLVPIMTLMWLSTCMCVLAAVPRISFLAALVIAGCVTSTDPILSQAVAKGPFADKYVARPLREIISAEAGANDGFASPFLMLAVNLIRLSQRSHEGIVDEETVVQQDRGVGPQTTDVGIALGNWAVETLVYIVILPIVYGAVCGTLARLGVKFSLSRRWIDTESYLLFPTALGLFIVGTCGAIGTSDLLACFIAGCALNWDGVFLEETEKRHDEVNTCIDVLLNFGGFMYLGSALPWDEFNQPKVTGITYMHLFGVGFLVIALRRIPALLLTCWAMLAVVKNWKEAHTRLLFPPRNEQSASERHLVDAISPVVYFLVLFSIVVHGLSIPILSAIYHYTGVQPITNDAEEIKRVSSNEAPPSNSRPAGPHHWMVFNRFIRPVMEQVSLPFLSVRKPAYTVLSTVQTNEIKESNISIIRGSASSGRRTCRARW
ncbi:Sodium/hydrogen exchanger family-domain-containing protein [Xylariaceae sp. FL0016]|nr:Sodium/hydrogen exchanger family-domain-containing protein [Xylariaceae sp. FL0016]